MMLHGIASMSVANSQSQNYAAFAKPLLFSILFKTFHVSLYMSSLSDRCLSLYFLERLGSKYFGILSLYALHTITSTNFIYCMPLQRQSPDYLLGTEDVQHLHTTFLVLH